MIRNLLFALLWLIQCQPLLSQSASPILVEGLNINHARQPFGIDDQHPLFGWYLGSAPGATNLMQRAFQLQVASTRELLEAGKPDLWDTEKRISNQNINIRYEGENLGSEMKCFWRARTWDQDDKQSSWSAVSSWTMGLLAATDWKGSWIRDNKPAKADSLLYGDDPAPLFEKKFTAARKIASAYLHVSGLGFNHVYLNGKKIGDRYLDPAWTSYAKTILYTSYDVTRDLKTGSNQLGVLLGNGWYNPLPLKLFGAFDLRKELATGPPAFLLQLNITYTDGTREEVVSDNSWPVRDSYIIRNSIYLGEKHDMSVARFPQTATRTVVQQEGLPKQLVAGYFPPVRITETIRPVSITRRSNGNFIVDFGKNFAGTIRLVAAGKKGTVVDLRYGELLYEDGSLNMMTSVTAQLKRKGAGGPGAPDTAYHHDQMLLSGAGKDTLLPMFSYTGFRYVEVSGFPGTLSRNDIAGFRLNTDVEPVTVFSSSDSLLNKIYRASLNSFLSNIHGVQSDCPHREKLGYGADIAVSCTSFMLNYNMNNFYRKTLQDFADEQLADGAFTETAPFVGIADLGLTKNGGPVGWGYVYPVLMEELFRYYGDTALLAQYYDPLKRWIDYLQLNAKDLIIDKGISDHESLDPKPVALTETAIFFRSARLLTRFATVLGKTNDATHYNALADRIRDAFLKKFLDPSSGRFDQGTQAAQAFALEYELVPDSLIAKSVNLLHQAVVEKDHHVATGIFGTLYLLKMLSENGHHDDAWKIVQQKTFPGWGFMLERGATSLWEHWDFSDNTFSHNHAMFGTVVEWAVSYLAGIRPMDDAAGFNKILIKPLGLNQLDRLECVYRSVNGPVSVKWTTVNGSKKLEITIPVNVKAILELPGKARSTLGSGVHKINL